LASLQAGVTNQSSAALTQFTTLAASTTARRIVLRD
jgi:hypothetical protein